MEQFLRTSLLLGDEAMDSLSRAHVAVFGVGGVGSYAAEALVRSGLGQITLIDFDTIDITNLNRQVPALLSTVGQAKVAAMKNRLRDINKDLKITTLNKKYTPENSEEFFDQTYDYVVDAIDIITSKIHLIVQCKERNIPILSSMGMGNKLDPTRIKIVDLYKTHMCPLAKVMRKELKDRNIKSLDVVFSDEKPRKPSQSIAVAGKREVPASCAFVPPVAGLIMASHVVREITGQ